jgi:hypothetical protein
VLFLVSTFALGLGVAALGGRENLVIGLFGITISLMTIGKTLSR